MQGPPTLQGPPAATPQSSLTCSCTLLACHQEFADGPPLESSPADFLPLGQQPAAPNTGF